MSVVTTLAFMLAMAAVPGAVIPSFREANPNVQSFHEVARLAAGEGMDLLVVLGTAQKQPSPWWSKGDLLGIFLADTAQPGRAYRLAMLPGRECLPRVERAVPGELLLSCEVEKGQPEPNLKFFYSARSKSISAQHEYPPFSIPVTNTVRGRPEFIAGNTKDVLRILPNGSFKIVPGRTKTPLQEWTTPGQDYRLPARPEFKPVHLGPGGRFTLVQDPDPSWGSRRTRIVEGRNTYTLPHPICDEYKKARPEDFKLNGCPHDIQEDIGPYQVVSNRLWFGKSFYDSEGMGGVGAAGYFDADERRFVLFSPPELARFSVSALLVEADTVWLALHHRGEWGDSPGGLLECELSMNVRRKHDIGGIAYDLVRYEDALYMGTSTGIALLRNGQVTRYAVDVNRAGRYIVSELEKVTP